MAPTTVDVAPLPPAILNARNGIVGNKEALHAEMVGLVHDDKFAERWTSIKAHVEQFIATVEKDTMDGVHGIEAWFQNPANLKAFVTWVNYGGKFGTAVYNQFVRGELPVPTNAQTVVSDLILLLRDFSSLFTGSEKEELTSQQQVLLDTVVDNLEMVRGVAGTPAKAAANGAPEPPAEDAAAAAAAAEPSAAASSSAA